MIGSNCWLIRGAFAMALVAAGTCGATEFADSASDSTLKKSARPVRAKVQKARPPLVFEKNRGQDDPAALFLGRFGGYTAQFLADEVRFARPATDAAPSGAARVALADANRTAVVRGDQRQTSYANYYRGSDPNEWLTGIPHYTSVVYKQVYPGIDWVWYGTQGRLEYDFRVAPGADPRQARLQFGEEDALRLDENGDLVIAAAGRESRYLRPVVYQEAAGGRQPVAGEYVLLAENRMGFELGDYDSSRELVIDPVLSYSGYFGDSRAEESASVVVDASGSAFVASKSGNDVVVFKLKPDGSGVDFTVVLAGSSTDATACQGSAIAVDATGNIFVTGETLSSNFPPTAGAYSRNRSGAEDIFVTRLNADGTMSYSTFLGGSGSDSDPCIALGPDGGVYIAAETDSTNFPTTAGAYDREFELMIDLTVSRLRLNGQGANDLIYSTYVGGLCNDRNPGLVVGDDGMIYVVAETGLPASFPTTPGAFDPTHNGEIDIVFFKLNPGDQGDQDLMYSTYFGGSGWDERFSDGKGIALYKTGNVYFAGDTDSQNTPIPTTAGAFDHTFNGEWDTFIVKFSPNAEGRFDLAFSTLFGGSGIDDSAGIVVDDAGIVYFSGRTDSENVPLPSVNPTQPGYGGGDFEAFVGALSPDDSQVLFSTYFGGSNSDCCPDLFIDGNGRLTVVGDTTSSNFPMTANVSTTGAFRKIYAGSGDVFVSRFEQLGIRMVTNSNATNVRPEFASETIANGYGVGLAGQTLGATASTLAGNAGGGRRASHR